jgi:hypothetical protein
MIARDNVLTHRQSDDRLLSGPSTCLARVLGMQYATATPYGRQPGSWRARKGHADEHARDVTRRRRTLRPDRSRRS